MSTRLKDWPTTATTVDSDDYFGMDGATNNSQKILGSSLKTDFASTFSGDATTYKLCELDGSNKIPVSRLPAGASTGNDLGDHNVSTNTPTVIDGTGTLSDYYTVTVGGSRDYGSGSITLAAGDILRYDGSVWYKVPGVANLFDGSATQAAAATAGDYLQTADVNDRTSARQPSNGGYYNGTDSVNTVADTNLLSFGNSTTDSPFSLAAEFEIDDLTSGFDIVSKMKNPNYEWRLTVDTGGLISLSLWDNGVINKLIAKGTTVLTTGKKHHVVATYNGNASSYTDINLYWNGEAETLTDASGGSYVAMHNTSQAVEIGEGNAVHANGKIHSVLIFNRELTATQVARLGVTGNSVEVADQWGGTEVTSGTLEVGQRYRISNFQSGDDFTNVGASSNATDVEFIATGTTPTTWSNSSGITPIGAVAAYLPESVESDGSIRDASSNGLHASATSVTPLRKTQVVDIDAESPAADSMLLDVKVAGSSKAGIDAEGTIRQENLATDAPVAKYAADAITTAGTVSHQIPIDIGGTTYYLVAHTHGS